MKSDTMTAGEKQAKVLEFVKSAEFQKCPNEQKIEFPGHSRSSVAGLFLCVQRRGLSGYPFRGWLPVQDSLNRCAALGMERDWAGWAAEATSDNEQVYFHIGKSN